MRTYEDFAVGHTGSLGQKLVVADEVVAFALEFDPQPFHLDVQAGKASLLGGLAASGWHTSAMLMRMIYDAFLHETAGLGSPGIDEVKWLKPVLVGDLLTGRYEVHEARLSKSRPGLGILRVYYELKNQRDEPVISWDCVQFVATRDGLAASAGPFEISRGMRAT